MNNYELTYINSSELTQEEVETIAKEIESFIQKNEGVVLRRENPVPKMLSYSIKNKNSVFFNTLIFQLEPEKINELKEKIEKNEKIIRHILVTKNLKEKVRTRRLRKKIDLVADSESSKKELSEKDTFSFSSPFSSVITEDVKNQKTENEEELEINSNNKKTENKSEKTELKDIEKKLEEILSE